MWPALLEQAYAEHEGGHYEDIAQRQGRDPTGEVLHGTETDFDTTEDLTPADLHETWEEDGSITLSSFQEDEAPDSDRYEYLEDDDTPGEPIDPEDSDAGYTLYTNHVYVVTDVRDNGDVEVFNPHGPGQEQVVPFDEIDESFAAVRTNDLD